MTDNVFLEQILDHIVLAIEVVAVIFITGIVIYFLIMFSRLSIATIRGKRVTTNLRELVYRFLRELLISLDFVIAADILKTIFNRSVEELVTLAIVVTIRILLSWSLSKDFELYEKRVSGECESWIS
jgi:uncharacterized membrane protein